MIAEKFVAILKNFLPQSVPFAVHSLEEGHINDTYKVDFENDTQGYILQRINTSVFKNPHSIAHNHLALLQHQEFTDGSITIPRLYQTINGQFLFTDNAGDVWRLTNFIMDSYPIEVVSEDWQAYEAGHAFGWFARKCDVLKAGDFSESIKDFHRLSFRLKQLDDSISSNSNSRSTAAKSEIEFYLARRESLLEIEYMVDNGIIPIHVVHNDTKINNLLFRQNKAIAVIDLDTMGPGILFYDYGDALRTIANTAAEDEKNLALVDFNLTAFKSFSEGYLQQVRPMLVEAEINNLHLAPVLMTYIIGIRFLADYLNGDVYFKTAYAEHNLVRSRVQQRLIGCMEADRSKIKRILDDLIDSQQTF